MKRRLFGQYCGLARALELVGERWALLIIRDLLVRPRRYTDLLTSLPGIPTNVLATRLKELEEAGVVARQIAPSPQRGVVYALTADGAALEQAVLALGRWGTSQLGQPLAGEVVTPSALSLSLRNAFRPTAAAGVNAVWEIHAADIVVHITVADGRLTVDEGAAPETPDLVMTFDELDGPPAYAALARAAKCGLVRLKGRRALLPTFLELFTAPSAS